MYYAHQAIRLVPPPSAADWHIDPNQSASWLLRCADVPRQAALFFNTFINATTNEPIPLAGFPPSDCVSAIIYPGPRPLLANPQPASPPIARRLLIAGGCYGAPSMPSWADA